jgi:hypothetical protein
MDQLIDGSMVPWIDAANGQIDLRMLYCPFFFVLSAYLLSADRQTESSQHRGQISCYMLLHTHISGRKQCFPRTSGKSRSCFSIRLHTDHMRVSFWAFEPRDVESFPLIRGRRKIVASVILREV